MPQHSKRYDEEKCEQDVDHKSGKNVPIFNVRIHAREVILIEARLGRYVVVASRRHYSFESKRTSFKEYRKRAFFFLSSYIFYGKRELLITAFCVCVLVLMRATDNDDRTRGVIACAQYYTICREILEKKKNNEPVSWNLGKGEFLYHELFKFGREKELFSET